MKRWCAGDGAFGAAQAVHLWTMRFAHRPACRGQRIRVAHRAGLRPQAPQPPTTINEPVSQLWSYRGDKYSDAGGFTPTCESNRLQECDSTALVNTYDNTIYYTSRVLAQIIDWLAAQRAERDAMLIYVSDHGESLGEGGVYLHGMPRWMAPHEQFHVPMLMWMNEGAWQTLVPKVSCLQALAAQPSSHDNLYHTVLGAFDVQTSVYRQGLDMLAAGRSVKCQDR